MNTPRVRRDNVELYPQGTITIHPNVTEDTNLYELYRVYRESEEQKTLFNTWIERITKNPEQVPKILTEYETLFKNNARFFDLHGHTFQDFCLCLTNTMSQPEIRKLSLIKDHSRRRILRSRVYAISTRHDIDWHGNKITNEQEQSEKKQYQVDHLKSLVLYDWYHESTPTTDPIIKEPCTIPIRVVRQGTQETVEQLVEEYGTEKLIAWVNFAAGHNVCGAYSVDHGGSQEEEVATNCDGAALLGTNGDLVFRGVKAYMRGVWVSYNPGKHIPPGGNYFSKTKFVTGPKHVECVMIAAAFADFRPYMPYLWPYSERADYFTWMGIGGIKNEEELDARLMMDIDGVLKTCVANNVEILVTGASGCGAFLHEPYREARLWKSALELPQYKHIQVVFAVLDKEDSPNWKAFSTTFEV
jgi:hypothetical protein